jgi:V8-like Glu-specific endopeptidase
MMEYSKVPSFTETGLNSPITEFALPLTARKGNEFFPSGTAVVIAPYLALTAKHVIEDYWIRFEQEECTVPLGQHRHLNGEFTSYFKIKLRHQKMIAIKQKA